MPYTVTWYINEGNNPRFLHGLKICPVALHGAKSILSEELGSIADFSVTADIPYSDTYTVFWLKQEATNEQIETVKSYLNK